MPDQKSPRTHQGTAKLRAEAYALVPQLPPTQAAQFKRRLAKAKAPGAFRAITAEMQSILEAIALRAATIPEVSFPEQLPVTARKDDIAAAIAKHQVVIVAGETGSGKTTQLPKILLDQGFGRQGLIGHTQPRRLAARTVAERIAEEIGQPIGETVGYAIRFDDVVGPATAVKLMTDGILLAEIQRDRFLSRYEVIIIDEAHERSLNIDFLLGYLKQLLPNRPDLKVIITSATIDPDSFARHFTDTPGQPAPIIEVSGRTYPVEVRYRPLTKETSGKETLIDPLEGLIDALKELMAEGPGDILCFFPGEADIRDAMEAIDGQRWKNVEVAPLFGRLSNAEQHRVFRPHSGRRIILSTNIAETSLTVPGIHYVIDTGAARISRYSTRTKVQRLPIEEISQASANQRSGRCGRVADGVAIRLYSEENFLSRPEFTDPEILRTNLASVILQMALLNLGSIEDFPFLQAPDTRAIRDGVLLLHELGALKHKENATGDAALTQVGRQIARIPVDPRLARMLVEAHTLGCLTEVQVIVAGMSIRDVRERPMEYQAQATQMHSRFKNTHSDFLSYLALWAYIGQVRRNSSGNAFRKQMQREFLHYMRIREWYDLVRQLKSIAQQLDWDTGHDMQLDHYDPTTGEEINPNQSDAIHRSLLTGLLSHIGLRKAETKEYQGARGTSFMIFPGSHLAKKPPQFVMAAELVETTRLWARDVASIDPTWVERLAGNLIKRQYSAPFWSTKKAAAMVHERSTLYGVPIVADRVTGYRVVDLEGAREMFIREALVGGNWTTHHAFFHDNVAKLERAEELEHRARRRDIVVDDEALVDFYKARIPDDITDGIRFHSWWKKASKKNPQLLDFDPEALTHGNADRITVNNFPEVWRQGSLEYELRYTFDPTSPFDGVTLTIPVPLLAGIRNEGFDWLVPGMREELIVGLIRTLPKQQRRHVVPAPEFAARILNEVTPQDGEPMTVAMARALNRIVAANINAGDFQPSQLPAHLRMTFAIIDRHGAITDKDKDLEALKQRRHHEVKSSVSKASRKHETKTAKYWTKDSIGTVAEEVLTKVDGQEVVAYPALTMTPEGVMVTIMPTAGDAQAAMMQTTLTLLAREIPVATNQMLNGLALRHRVAVENYPHGGAAGLCEDARITAMRDLLMEKGGPVRDPDQYAALRDAIKPEVPSRVRQTVVALAPAIDEWLDRKSP